MRAHRPAGERQRRHVREPPAPGRPPGRHGGVPGPSLLGRVGGCPRDRPGDELRAEAAHARGLAGGVRRPLSPGDRPPSSRQLLAEQPWKLVRLARRPACCRSPVARRRSVLAAAVLPLVTAEAADSAVPTALRTSPTTSASWWPWELEPDAFVTELASACSRPKSVVRAEMLVGDWSLAWLRSPVAFLIAPHRASALLARALAWASGAVVDVDPVVVVVPADFGEEEPHADRDNVRPTAAAPASQRWARRCMRRGVVGDAFQVMVWSSCGRRPVSRPLRGAGRAPAVGGSGHARAGGGRGRCAPARRRRARRGALRRRPARDRR